MRRPTLLSLVLAGTALTGCGGVDRPVGAPAAVTPGVDRTVRVEEPATTPARPRRGRAIRTVGSRFGTILSDARGQALYAFDAESSARPRCYGACARAWPPVLTRGRPVARTGVAGRLGTTRRRSGRRQVTVEGRPLYFYVGDSPGRVLCQNVDEFGGLWRVVHPDGTPVR